MKSHWTNSLKLRYQKIAHDFVNLVKTKSLKISCEVNLNAISYMLLHLLYTRLGVQNSNWQTFLRCFDYDHYFWAGDGTFELGVLGDLDPAISSQLGSGNYFGGFDVKITACSFHNFKRFENTTTCVSWNSEKKNRVNVFLSVSRAG